jgi:hypothetical protein
MTIQDFLVFLAFAVGVLFGIAIGRVTEWLHK